MDAVPAPFTSDDYGARMQAAAAAAAEEGLDGLLVTPGPDLLWLTGYQPTATTERLTLLVLRHGVEPHLLVPILERPDAESTVGAEALIMRDWRDGTDPYAAAAQLLPADGTFAISDTAWALHLLGLQAELTESRYSSVTERLPMLRAVKDGRELARMEAAGAAADATFREIVKVPFAGRKETDVAADLARFLREFGHEQVDFTVVGSGPNGANPHHEAGDRTILSGDMVVLDFGGLMYGYGSDTSRTVCVGEPTSQMREVHEIVRVAQQTAFEAVRPGIACQEIDRVARRVITEAGYGDEFIHRTGHGIGMTTHEPPYIVEGEERPVVPGMCFSIEPGIYLAGRFGVRIEDIVTVTEDGGRRFNDTDRGLTIVE
ncbi:aminopeptidase P family protein [Microbacterium sp. M3]|uniref:Aminopeptidase P family protein n=1 Tax=Microbacterium arthrosphaerae TaxID=792652 RepID=A0ABU4H5S5_9MICO|nr:MULTISPECIES: aminopeptidase P family protein [Microbacterium]MDW4573244.1 aminopeptidase P family protein [Microbacterium arthrosphaerae]MDW7607099.1 aminopeptidase P family protein [Microbacterium sp. M3]